MNSPSGPGKTAVNSVLSCILFMLAPLVFLTRIDQKGGGLPRIALHGPAGLKAPTAPWQQTIHKRSQNGKK
jgi:hypothetical protein